MSRCWDIKIGDHPTPALIAGGLVVLADRRGVVQAVDQAAGKNRWTYYVDGPVFAAPQISGGVVVVGASDGRVYALRLADGKLLWRRLVALRDERIHFYDRLISRWPVSGGIVVNEGVVYAAAGIAHYDGLRVCALSLNDGRPIWCNDSSGVVNRGLRNGVSLQGPLYIRDDELRFAGGSPYSIARYRLKDGSLLNEPFSEPEDLQKGTASPTLYPLYGQFVALRHRLSDGRILDAQVMYEGSQPTPLGLYPAGSNLTQRASRTSRRGPALWQRAAGTRYNAFVVCRESHVLHAEQTGSRFAPRARLTCTGIADGNEVWSYTLPQPAVRNGCSVAPDGMIIVCLRDGEILALRPGQPTP
ncbi:MAG: outer membrane protein assembly factor BamB family protein [Planctomycetota bacterium]